MCHAETVVNHAGVHRHVDVAGGSRGRFEDVDRRTEAVGQPSTHVGLSEVVHGGEAGAANGVAVTNQRGERPLEGRDGVVDASLFGQDQPEVAQDRCLFGLCATTVEQPDRALEQCRRRGVIAKEPMR